MVHHARHQIVAVGVYRFNVNEVLRASGGSKATLAKYFGDRTGLIAAAIGAEARAAMAALALDTSQTRFLSLEASLKLALAGVLRFYLTPGALSLYRAVVGTAGNDPRAAIAFYREGHAVVVDTIAHLIEERKGLDARADLDARDVADKLVHLVRAGVYERTLIGIETPFNDEDEIARTIAAAVALVLPALSAQSHLDPPKLA